MKKIVLAILAVLVAVAAVTAWNWLRDNRLPAFEGESVELYVYPDTPVQEVLDSIASQTTVKWPRRLAKVFEKHEVATYMSPGHYVIEPSFTATYVTRMLNNCWQTPVRVVLSGTLRRKPEIARKIANQLMLDSTAVITAMNDNAFLSRYGYDTTSVFAMMLPDTYEMYWTASVEDFFDVQTKAVDAFWTEENLAKAKKLGLTRRQATIVASIVSGETHYVPEMPKIAGVYLNRLRIGMKLQADPTIAYCYDYDLQRVLKRNLEIDSPYNTYRYGGLPPGPIYVPTKNTLNAVLNPDFGGGNLFFCADPSFNGSHRFARTYSQHLTNARAYQRALDQRNSSPAK